MGHPNSPLTFGVTTRSSDSRLWTRYPRGDAPNPGSPQGLGVTAAVAAALGGATGGGGTAPGLQDYWGLTPDRYVSASASGSDNGLSESTPWTWAQYLSSATSGMVVGVMPGTYSRASTSSNSVPAFNLVAGTTVVCKRAAAYNVSNRSEFRNGVTSGDNGCPTIGVNGGSNAVWIGPYVSENVSRSSSDTGPAALRNTTGSQIKGARIDGITVARGDNHNCIRLEDVHECLVSSCMLSGCRNSPSFSQNHAAVMAYNTTASVVEHCDISDCDVGIFMKGIHDGDIGGNAVRYNRVTNCGYAIYTGGPNNDSSLDANPYEFNLIIDCEEAFAHNSYDAVSPSEVHIRHNTVVNISAKGIGWANPAGSGAYRDEVIENNLFVSVAMIYSCGNSGGISDGQLATINAIRGAINHNAVYTFTTWARQNDTNYNSRAAWNTKSGWDANSTTLTGNPFVNPGAGDYRLNNTAGAGAAARVASSTGGPVGCFITGDESPGLQQAA